VSPASEAQAIRLLELAVTTAQQIGDRRSESFALGELGHVYECRSNYQQASLLTQQARSAAEQGLRAKDSLYLWEWQAGRLLKAQGKSEEAIPAYERAIATLEEIRSELLIANQDLQFDFQDTIDPLYRELVALRLEREQIQPGQRTTVVHPENIGTALHQLDSLKLAELQNYFGNDCVVTAINPEPVTLVSENSATAVFSSIILDDRTAIVVSFPSGQQQLAWIDQPRGTIRTAINQYRLSLERYFEEFDPQHAAQMYDWLIAPFATALQSEQIKTLVFIQDSILRSVPMAALYDGVNQQFLVEKYAIATTPSLTLTDLKPIDRRNLRALALGLTEARTVDGRTFPSLANVDQEIDAVTSELSGSKSLLNQEFTRDRLQQELDTIAYPILHIATHGEFSTEPENTFLVTGDGQKLTIFELETMIRNARLGGQLELLSLTACETATGDDRSALGLAGVAIQAGARSAVASLWFIDDAATANIAAQFYSNLRTQPNFNKAQAWLCCMIRKTDRFPLKESWH
jgi:CHAT domain-containing protein